MDGLSGVVEAGGVVAVDAQLCDQPVHEEAVGERGAAGDKDTGHDISSGRGQLGLTFWCREGHGASQGSQAAMAVCFVAQALSWSMRGMSSFPRAVRAYSTRGGVSLKVLRLTMPAATRSSSRWVSVTGLIERVRLMSLKRRGDSCCRSQMMVMAWRFERRSMAAWKGQQPSRSSDSPMHRYSQYTGIYFALLIVQQLYH